MINAHEFTRFNRTPEELQEMLLFSILVAGKRADQTAMKLERLLLTCSLGSISPFGVIRRLIADGALGRKLRQVRVGQYRRVAAAFRAVVKLDPATCTLDDLEAVPGIGPKTARMFLMHSRPGQRFAALDTHILAWLREWGVEGVPATTPQAASTYRRLECHFLALCDRLGYDPADLDLAVWRSRTRSKRVKELSEQDQKAVRVWRRRARTRLERGAAA